MEKEPQADRYRVMRAVRSLAYNRALRPVIVGRIERAEAKVRGYMLANGMTSSRIGAFLIDLDEENDISVERLAIDDWQQLSLPRVNALEGAVEMLNEPSDPIESETGEGNGQVMESRRFSVVTGENR